MWPPRRRTWWRAATLWRRPLRREAIFSGEWLEEGVHVSGIGANTPAKRELDATTLRRSKIVVDFKDQALEEGGDLREALKSGSIGLNDVYAELGDRDRAENRPCQRS